MTFKMVLSFDCIYYYHVGGTEGHRGRQEGGRGRTEDGRGGEAGAGAGEAEGGATGEGEREDDDDGSGGGGSGKRPLVADVVAPAPPAADVVAPAPPAAVGDGHAEAEKEYAGEWWRRGRVANVAACITRHTI